MIAAVTAQQRILRHPWPDGAAVRVRMGLHTGEARVAEAAYVGVDVHRAARICAAPHGGQILLSDTVCALVIKDLIRPSRRWVERWMPHLIHYNILDRGGHFAAWEHPALHTKEIRDCFAKVR